MQGIDPSGGSDICASQAGWNKCNLLSCLVLAMRLEGRAAGGGFSAACRAQPSLLTLWCCMAVPGTWGCTRASYSCTGMVSRLPLGPGSRAALVQLLLLFAGT